MRIKLSNGEIRMNVMVLSKLFVISELVLDLVIVVFIKLLISVCEELDGML